MAVVAKVSIQPPSFNVQEPIQLRQLNDPEAWTYFYS
jgi:hypothetical protein